MKEKPQTLKCTNPKCLGDLNPLGNFSYGDGKTARFLKRYVRFHIPLMILGLVIFMNFTPDSYGPRDAFGLLALAFFCPILIILLIAKLLPKTTRMSCHHCGHTEEKLGKLINLSPIDGAENIEAVALRPVKPGTASKKAKPTKRHKKRVRLEKTISQPVNRRNLY